MKAAGKQGSKILQATLKNTKRLSVSVCGLGLGFSAQDHAIQWKPNLPLDGKLDTYAVCIRCFQAFHNQPLLLQQHQIQQRDRQTDDNDWCCLSHHSWSTEEHQQKKSGEISGETEVLSNKLELLIPIQHSTASPVTKGKSIRLCFPIFLQLCKE